MSRRQRILERLRAALRPMTEAELVGALWADGDLHANERSVRIHCQGLGQEVHLVRRGTLGKAKWEAVTR